MTAYIKNLKTKMQKFQSGVTRVATFNDAMLMLTIFHDEFDAFGADYVSPHKEYMGECQVNSKN